MDAWLQVPMVVGLFVLRLGVPLAITLAVGYWLHKLDIKWEAEAVARREQARLASQKRVSRPQADIDIGKVIRERCWDINECPQTLRVGCPAWKQPNLACWEARLNVEGQLPDKCDHCELYGEGGRVSATLPH